MSSKRAERLERSATEEVLKPEIKSVRVVNKKKEEIDVTKYGKEILIEVVTDNALACKLVLTAKNSDWKEPKKRFEKQWPVQPSASPAINEGKNFISFTPQVEWLKDIEKHSEKTVFEVSLHASVRYSFYIKISYLEEVGKKESKEIKILPIVVVIDPGHGGKDPGVPAYKNKRHEKEIVLITGKYLRDLLKGMVKVVMTREEDIFPSLADRVKTSKDKKADLFISIHVDSGGSEKTDEKGNKKIVYNEDVDTVRVFKRKSPNKETKALSKNLVSKLDKVVTSSKSVVDIEASHHVTREQSTLVAAVLIEIGFITNKEQEDLMNDDSYLLKIATAIKDGVIETIQN